MIGLLADALIGAGHDYYFALHAALARRFQSMPRHAVEELARKQRTLTTKAGKQELHCAFASRGRQTLAAELRSMAIDSVQSMVNDLVNEENEQLIASGNEKLLHLQFDER